MKREHAAAHHAIGGRHGVAISGGAGVGIALQLVGLRRTPLSSSPQQVRRLPLQNIIRLFGRYLCVAMPCLTCCILLCYVTRRKGDDALMEESTHARRAQCTVQPQHPCLASQHGADDPARTMTSRFLALLEPLREAML